MVQTRGTVRKDDLFKKATLLTAVSDSDRVGVPIRQCTQQHRIRPAFWAKVAQRKLKRGRGYCGCSDPFAFGRRCSSHGMSGMASGFCFAQSGVANHRSGEKRG